MLIKKDEYGEKSLTVFGWLFISGLIVGFIGGLMYLLPTYSVWSRELRGKAALKEAEWDRRIQIEEAQANLESEKLNAQSEVERAKGMAEAIRIEGGNLTEQYIRYLWVRQQVNLNDKTVIYLPTEAGLPILEADRLGE
jgi:hypothetical protein